MASRTAGIVKPGSQAARIVHVLRNANGWMTTQDILAGAGYCPFSARISELRGAGYDIRCRKIEGMSPGPDAQEYLLVSEPLNEPDRGDQSVRVETPASHNDAAALSAAISLVGVTDLPSGSFSGIAPTALPGTATAVPTELNLFNTPSGAYGRRVAA